MMSQNIIENVVKQGYLKKGTYGTNRLSGLFRRNDASKWFVFTIRQGVPFLEYYDSDVDVFTQQPINSFNLSSCQNVKFMGNSSPHSFCVVCPDRVIELVASSRTQMVEWVHEMEASLIRLGVLKNEVIDHVYTVCPAVVRKARIKKETFDDNETDVSQSTFPKTDSIQETRNSETQPPQAAPTSSGVTDVVLPLRPSRTISMRPGSRAPLAARSSYSFHGPSHAPSLELTAPPPLPLRLASSATRKRDHKAADKTDATGTQDSQHMYEGSNDSDFVSPEVIAELRQQHQALSRAPSSPSTEIDTETRNISSPSVSQDTYIAMNSTYFECSNAHHRSPSPDIQTELKSSSEPLNISEELVFLPLNLDDDCTLSLSHSSFCDKSHDSLSRPQQVIENEYSCFPFQEVASVNDMYCNVDTDHFECLIPKPTPMPRKSLPIMSVPDELILPPSSDPTVFSQTVSFCQADSVAAKHEAPEMYVNSEVLSVCDKKVVEEEDKEVGEYDNLQRISSELIHQNSESEYDNVREQDLNSQQTEIDLLIFHCKEADMQPSKDENENVYGLVLHDEPPTTVAPPVPTTRTPPLPTTVAPPVPTAVAPPVLTTVEPPVLTTRGPPVPTTVAPPLPTTRTPPVPAAVAPPVPTTIAPPILTTMEPPVLTTMEPPILTTMEPPVLTTMEPPILTTKVPPVPTTVAPPIPTTVPPPVPTTVVPLVPTTVAPPVPTTVAPPIPTVPPLPPRQDSLQARDYDCRYIELRTVSSSTDVKSPMSSILPSAFSATTSKKHRSLPSDSATAPPLPDPRRSALSFDGFRKSFSDFAKSVDIPPKPPRRKGLNSSQSQDDLPPALPSRDSQSFYIKRPQITGLSNSFKSSIDHIVAQPSADEQVVSNHETRRAANNATNLSRKMMLDRSHSLHTVVSLKQTQAEILQTEISMASVVVVVAQKAGLGIALVDWNNFPCVVGWNQKDFPSLHGKLHVGDLIFSINNVRVTSSETAHKLLKQTSSSYTEIMLHRMPYAKVFAIHRNAEGQSLGIKREGGTGEIVYVDPNGLAAQHGLTAFAQGASGNGRSHWFLTEINNRPLSLFFKDDEIDHRLSAVGREISLVVQPFDFIYEIRRQFKKVKNYKTFITQ